MLFPWQRMAYRQHFLAHFFPAGMGFLPHRYGFKRRYPSPQVWFFFPAGMGFLGRFYCVSSTLPRRYGFFSQSSLASQR